MNLIFFKLSAFERGILEECPAMKSGASFIKYITYFQVVISFIAGWLALSLFNYSNGLLNLFFAALFTIIHVAITKEFDYWMHQYRNWRTLLGIIFCIFILSFFQTIFISNYLFRAEFEISNILINNSNPDGWVEKIIYYSKKPFYTLSFKNRIVSSLSIAMLIFATFIGILPFILTFYYRNSKYYFTKHLIENYKLGHEQISHKEGV